MFLEKELIWSFASTVLFVWDKTADYWDMKYLKKAQLILYIGVLVPCQSLVDKYKNVSNPVSRLLGILFPWE